MGVGIYVPNDAADVLPTNTDNELVEDLEDDDRVTGEKISERPVFSLDTTGDGLINSNASFQYQHPSFPDTGGKHLNV